MFDGESTDFWLFSISLFDDDDDDDDGDSILDIEAFLFIGNTVEEVGEEEEEEFSVVYFLCSFEDDDDDDDSCFLLSVGNIVGER